MVGVEVETVAEQLLVEEEVGKASWSDLLLIGVDDLLTNASKSCSSVCLNPDLVDSRSFSSVRLGCSVLFKTDLLYLALILSKSLTQLLSLSLSSDSLEMSPGIQI